MSAPTAKDAKARALVQLADGRTATLVAVAVPEPRGRKALRPNQAKVQLPGSGAYLTVPASSLVLVEPQHAQG